MKWDDPISDRPNTTVVGVLELGYAYQFSIDNREEQDTLTRFGAVATKILESKLVLRETGSGKVVFSGSLMELAFARLRSIGIGGGS